MSQQNSDIPFLLGKPIVFNLSEMSDEQIQGYLEYAELAVAYVESSYDAQFNHKDISEIINYWLRFKTTALSELERRYLLS